MPDTIDPPADAEVARRPPSTDPREGRMEKQNQIDAAAPHEQPGSASRPRRNPPALLAEVLAVAALAIGVLACGFSWMFFLRTYVLLAGSIAALLGLAGILVTRSGDHRRTLATAGVVLGALAILSVLTTETLVRHYVQDRLGGLFSDNSGPAATAPPADEAPRSAAATTSDVLPPAPGQLDPVGGTPPPLLGDLAPNNSAAPLRIGQAGEMDGYKMTITSVTTDAAEAIEGGGNPRPANGRYLLVELSATSTGEFAGTDAGNVERELSVGLAGGDGLEYNSTGCHPALDRPASSIPRLGAGETGSWQACIDTRPEALKGGSLFVQQPFASRIERIYWRLG